jgi:SAM-dependent methyltransferase
MQESRSFDSVAALCAEVRRGYPAALFDDLAAFGGLTTTAAVLEVGCGAGQATGDLAGRAGRLVALDPGENLIAEARRRVAAGANVTFQATTFEAFEAPPRSFDMVVSAQAWHWVDPDVGVAKAADLLTDDGAPWPSSGTCRRRRPSLWPPPSTAPSTATLPSSGGFATPLHGTCRTARSRP